MNKLKQSIDALTEKSDVIKKLCDKIRITSQKEIAQLHAGKKMNLSSIREDIKKLDKLTKDSLLFAVNRNLMFVAYQEYAEAELVQAIVNDQKLPELSIPEPCYFTGLCDAIGEVKRQFMIALIEKNRKKADRLLKKSLELSSTIAEIDASPNVINSLKPKKDLVQRSIESMLELSARNK